MCGLRGDKPRVKALAPFAAQQAGWGILGEIEIVAQPFGVAALFSDLWSAHRLLDAPSVGDLEEIPRASASDQQALAPA